MKDGAGLEAPLSLSHRTPLLTAGALATPGTALKFSWVSSQLPLLTLTPVQKHFRAVGQVTLEHSGRVASLAPGRVIFVYLRQEFGLSGQGDLRTEDCSGSWN